MLEKSSNLTNGKVSIANEPLLSVLEKWFVELGELRRFENKLVLKKVIR